MFQIVAFDMDGTTADTIPMCIKAFRNSVSPYTDHELSEEEREYGISLEKIFYFQRGILLYRRCSSRYKFLSVVESWG